MSDDVPVTINTELQNLKGDIIELALYMDTEEDQNDMAAAANHIRNVQHRREEI